MLSTNSPEISTNFKDKNIKFFANIDLDLTLHLGFIKNIDLLSRGLYGIKITLYYGENKQKIIPIGLFSAPSRFDAIVRDIRIPPPSQFTNCAIDNDSTSFQSRSFVIRYRDETHELNEGVHWRLTMPNCDLTDFHNTNSDDSVILCAEPLILQFELLFCELLEHDGSSDLINQIDDYLPPNPILTTVSTYDLQIQQASTGFHHYFPIRFDRSHTVSLDCMIHTAVTAIRYHRVSLDFLRSSSISEVTSAGSSALNKVGAKSDETSGTWYEQDIAASGPIIDESYCHLETTVSTSDMTQNSENQVRRAFKTPPTTIVKSSQRSKASNYSILTGKLIDIKSTIQNMSPTSSDEINSTPTKASRNSNELSANIQTKALRELNKMNSEDSIVEREAFSDLPRKMVSSSGLDQDDIEALIRVYSRPLISNHHLLREGTQWIIDLLNKFNQAELSRAKRLTPKVAARTSLDVLCDSAFDCSLERYYNDLVESLMLEESLSEVCTCLEQALERCNAEMCKRWSLVLSSLPKVMNEIVDVLRGKYVHGMRAFWKGQTLLFKCSQSLMKRPNRDDTSLYGLTNLLSQLQKEYKLSVRVRTASTEIVPGVIQPSQDVQIPPTLRPSVKARGLPLFDRATHLETSKLPVMLIHEYVDPNSGDEIALERGGVFKAYPCDVHMNSLANIWNKNSATQSYDSFDPCLSSFQLDQTSPPFHLVILQHGFQGTAFDMRLIRNALHMEFPNYMFMIATSNEADSGQSLAIMAQKLAHEILDFCREKCPSMIHDRNYHGRVSFIGHSVGGLIIRKCLESPELEILLSKLHIYISLASPHLGTLYAESQLVSTGMWALLKFKKTPILQELSLKDSTDYNTTALYQLSENGVFQYFRRIIFISSPSDLYVPEYSARVQVNPKAILNPHIGYTLTSMAANVLSQIESDKLYRITLDNNILEAGNVDKAIGRAGHICYLDNMMIAEGLIYTLYTVFKLI